MLVVTVFLGLALLQQGGWRIEDQQRRLHTQAELEGRVALVLGGGRNAAPRIEAWANAVVQELGPDADSARFRLLRVADLREIPRLMRSGARSHLPIRGTAAVLLDFEGILPRRYGFMNGTGNQIVLGPDGKVLARFQGVEVDSTQVVRIAAAVRTALASAVPASPDSRRPGIAPDEAGCPPIDASLAGRWLTVKTRVVAAQPLVARGQDLAGRIGRRLLDGVARVAGLPRRTTSGGRALAALDLRGEGLFGVSCGAADLAAHGHASGSAG